MVDILPAVSDFLSREQKLLIGGEWQPSASRETFETLNPATGELLCPVASGDAKDANRAVAAARKAFPAWAAMMPADREHLLRKFASLMQAHQDELAQLETLDNGKPYSIAFNIETNVAIGQMYYYAGLPTKLKGETYPVSSPGYHVYTRREPLGVCAAITPWNYSIVMAVQKIGPALAAGNTLVLKPAEQTPLTAIRLAELALEAGIPPGVLNLLTGYGHTAGSALTHHTDVDKVAFTGSTQVGKAIMQAAAGNLKHISLELGGKSPLIIFDDADIERAAETALWAIFANSGQNCVAGSRLYVQAGVYDKVIDMLANRTADLKVGAGLNDDTEIGPLISQTQLDRVMRYVDEADGQRVVGGERTNGSGYFMQPTVLRDMPDDSAVATEEIFGPVLATFKFDNEAEVIERANSSRFGLAAGIWTNHLGRAHRMAAALKAGVVWVNTYDWFDPSVPFGGTGESGYGRELGTQVMDMYTELKSVWVNIE